MKQYQNYKWPIVLFLLVTIHVTTQAQDSLYQFKSTGGVTGYGHDISANTHYNPIFFAGDFSWQFGKGERNDFLAFYLEPQFNLVATNRPIDIEFGTNIGLRYYQKISPRFYTYQMLGSGPHYITANLTRQAKGFIFSDNLAVGFYKEISHSRSLFLNFQFRVRHISNAGLKQPNGGVNTLNVLVGLSKLR